MPRGVKHLCRMTPRCGLALSVTGLAEVAAQCGLGSTRGVCGRGNCFVAPQLGNKGPACEEEKDASETKLGAGERDPPEHVLGTGDGDRDGAGDGEGDENFDGAA